MADGGGGVTWDSKGWVGYDRGRLWFRSEGETVAGRLESAEAHVLYGRPISRWWDVVVGVRQDVRPGPSETWAAVGIQGLAPYWFEVETTAYVGSSGRTLVRLEGEYELLFTNRWILQSLGEIELHGKSDPERATGAGLSTAEVGSTTSLRASTGICTLCGADVDSGVRWHGRLRAGRGP